MKFWIGNDKELSKQVQEILFGLGYSWHGERNIQYVDSSELYANDGIITFSNNREFFDCQPDEEINIDWMREKTISITLNGVKTEISIESAKALKEFLKDV